MWRKHIAIRTCAGCGAKDDKRQLVRIVRTGGGDVEVDEAGRKPGRGAYLCPRLSCWERGIIKERLGRALHTVIPPVDRETLLAHAQRTYDAAPVGQGGRQPG
jgi:predicted RNA-binding protein YlxR (DUF448 family)